MVLNAGQWSVKGFYLAAPYDNAVDGPTQLVTLVKKKTTNLYLSVPYQVPGTATGSITVAGTSRGGQGRVVHRPGLPVERTVARWRSRTRMRQ